jgi:small neutral amino acid transporter SnatA (MarC family)
MYLRPFLIGEYMIALLDIALALFVLAGSIFLGSVGYALIKELKGKDKDDAQPK